MWGIGYRLRERLAALGIRTALDLRAADPQWLQRQFSVVLARTVLELRGQVCLSLEETPPPRQQIVVSRTFGERLTALPDLQSAVSTFATRAAVKLRGQQVQAKALAVFIETNRFNPDEPQHGQQAVFTFSAPTQDSRVLVQAAQRMLGGIYRQGYRYKRAGVMLLDLASEQYRQEQFFADGEETSGASDLMTAVDAINSRFGREALQFGRALGSSRWQPVAHHHSPLYTTRWEDLVTAK